MNIATREFPDYKVESINNHKSNTTFINKETNNSITRDYNVELNAENISLSDPIIKRLSQIESQIQDQFQDLNFEQPFNEKKWHNLKIRNGGWGIYPLDVFKERFHILTQGIFKNMFLDKLVFNGSLVGACLYKNNYEKAFGVDSDKPMEGQKEQLMDYFEHYFPSKKSIKDKVTLLSEQELSDIDIIVDVQDNENFDRIVKRLFSDIKLEGKQLFKILNKRSYKYFIRAPELLRPLEIFRIFNTEPIDAIRKFHFPYVRNMFDGDDVYMLPSSFIFGTSGIIHEYQYLSTTEPRAKYILKYYNRGCNFNLSDSEHKYINAYIKRHPGLIS